MSSICSNCCIKLRKNSVAAQRTFDVKPFINKYNLNGIKYPSRTDDLKAFEKNNPTMGPK